MFIWDVRQGDKYATIVFNVQSDSLAVTDKIFMYIPVRFQSLIKHFY